MAELPSGTVTFLFTDIEGSTRMWDEHPDAMRDALASHDDMLRAAIESHDGHVVKSTGDGFHAVFAAADAGVAAAIAAQRALSRAEWGATGPVRVRMGLHTGVASLGDGDYFGASLNRAARLMAVAHGGQIVCSQATADLARDQLREGVTLADLGEHRLRDLSRPERVFQVRAPELDAEFPVLASVDAFPGNLPLQVSSFIGREREIDRTVAAVGEARVVTLTGVGGVGKTRLALQVAADVLPGFREGAWLVELAAVRDPDAVVDAFAAVFGVAARAGQTLEDSLIDFLRTKQLLLVVDNCEHLLEAVADVVEMLERACSGLVVLATSREGLALEGERVVPVPSLNGPAADADLDAAGRADAVHLFVERARGVDPDFVLTPVNVAAVVQVCRRLDGVPLAIELAAARVTTMSPTELARGLDRRFETLAGGRRRAVQRHQTLRAAIDWSYELLSDPERRLLARLAVFAGGCTRDAAENVCAGETIEAGVVFEFLAGLVARSLVVAERDRPETRYRLLETIREYGEERLAEHEETEILRARHARYYTELAAILSEDIRGPHQMEAGRRLLAEHENLLAAMNHAIDIDNVHLALRLLRDATSAPGAQVGYELRLPVDPILELTGASEHPLYPYGLALAAIKTAQRGDLESAETLCEQALDAQRRLGADPEPVVDVIVMSTRSAIAYSRGAVHDAAINLELVLEIVRPTGNLAWISNVLYGAATFHAMAGDPDAATPLATEGLALARRVEMPHLITSNLAALAGALADRDPERARALLRESIQLRASLDYENWGELTQAVLISARLRDWPLTLELASPSIRHLHWTGNRPLLATTFNLVASAVTPTAPDSAAVLQGAARSMTPTAPPATPTTMGPTSDAARARPPSPASFVTELRRETTGLLRDALGEQRLQLLRAEGQAMSTDDAVAYALNAITDAHRDHKAQHTIIESRR
jgi:predicted ATPase/class 3 adenylate cyclase